MKKSKLMVLILAIVILPSATFAKNVIVNLPKFPVKINGVKMDNEKSKYPLIVYRDITYFPLTYKNSRFMGLTTDWDKYKRIFSVSRDPNSIGEYSNYDQGFKNKNSYKAGVPTFIVNVNENRIINSKEKYPLLVFRDVTYFPLTWRFCHDEFDLNYSFTNRDGLVISSKSKDGSKNTEVKPMEKSAEEYSDKLILYFEKQSINGKTYLIGKNQDNYSIVVAIVEDGKANPIKVIEENGSGFEFDNKRIYYQVSSDTKKTIEYYDIEKDEVKEVLSINLNKWDPLLFTVLNDKIYYKISADKGALKDIDGKILSSGGLTGMRKIGDFVVATFDNKEILVFDRDQKIIYTKKANVDVETVTISGNKIRFLDADTGKYIEGTIK
ncbi:hypothetical protein [Peptoniphilus duerdenii]|uniref:hypothetical protein n=1 Tax=Peptoniphilus duerdenii TaxID=507750 RepID=UPI00288B7A51|nr:hypothetical protein [Peptoniphilus duerdenii]